MKVKDIKGDVVAFLVAHSNPAADLPVAFHQELGVEGARYHELGDMFLVYRDPRLNKGHQAEEALALASACAEERATEATPTEFTVYALVAVPVKTASAFTSVKVTTRAELEDS